MSGRREGAGEWEGWSALSTWPRGPARVTYWDEEVPWSPPNRGESEGEETLPDKLANC